MSGGPVHGCGGIPGIQRGLEVAHMSLTFGLMLTQILNLSLILTLTQINLWSHLNLEEQIEVAHISLTLTLALTLSLSLSLSLMSVSRVHMHAYTGTPKSNSKWPIAVASPSRMEPEYNKEGPLALAPARSLQSRRPCTFLLHARTHTHSAVGDSPAASTLLFLVSPAQTYNRTHARTHSIRTA